MLHWCWDVMVRQFEHVTLVLGYNGEVVCAH